MVGYGAARLTHPTGYGLVPAPDGRRKNHESHDQRSVQRQQLVQMPIDEAGYALHDRPSV